MPRYVHFATADVSFVAAPGVPTVATAAAPKADVTPEFVGADFDGRFTFSVGAYDLTTHHHLSAIHVTLYEKTAAVPSPVVPTDPAAIVAGQLHYVQPTNPTALPESPASVLAQTVVVDATAAPEGAYKAALVAEFPE